MFFEICEDVCMIIYSFLCLKDLTALILTHRAARHANSLQNRLRWFNALGVALLPRPPSTRLQFYDVTHLYTLRNYVLFYRQLRNVHVTESAPSVTFKLPYTVNNLGSFVFVESGPRSLRIRNETYSVHYHNCHYVLNERRDTLLFAQNAREIVALLRDPAIQRYFQPSLFALPYGSMPRLRSSER